MFRIKRGLKNLAAMVFIVVYLFSYANANLFWHCHTISGHCVMHSHFHGEAHHGPADGGHTCNGLILIAVADQATPTDKVVPVFDLTPLRPLLDRIQGSPVHLFQAPAVPLVTLRAPPVLG